MNSKLVSEFIGTFALVFCGTGAIIINEQTNGQVTHVGISMVFGLIVLAMIYTFGNSSGAHLNPAVSIGFVFANQFQSKYLIPYIVSQISGAILASLTLHFLFPDNLKLGETIPTGSQFQSFILEFILSFILMLVILRVSHGSKETGTLAGIAIGATVGLEALFAGPISGASMNPARSLAPAIISGNLNTLWIYLLAPLVGTIGAAYMFRLFK
ncbi:MAG: aquaporin [Saprospiraceae bacterium]